MTILICKKCAIKRYVSPDEVFCASCGAELPQQRLPYSGKHIESAEFKITFHPVVAVFDHQEAAREAAENSCWNEDSPLEGFDVQPLDSVVPLDQYPYVCGECGNYVSDTKECRCGACGAVSWVNRTQ